MLSAALASAGFICTSSHFDPSESVRNHPSSEIVTDWNRRREYLPVLRKDTKNWSERDFGPERVASSVIDEPIGRSKVRISTVVDVKEVQFKSYEPQHLGLLGSSHRTPSSCKEKKRTNW